MNLDELLETFQSNVTLPMFDQLSQQLGVSIESLRKLGVGYFPGEQTWIFPERDPKGILIGLLKRYTNGKKMMVEGSQRGLIFIPSAKYYKPLLEDYIRIHDAHVSCPICGKPDWCLVHRDDPTNPSSVICQRIETGSIRKVGDAGWLHTRRKSMGVETVSSSVFLIEPSDRPILVVEGATDVLAAYDLGFTAIGRPSAEGKIEMLSKLLKGRKVVIVGENDAGAGKAGMESTFKVLQTVCATVYKVMPPPTIKDLREWYKNGLTQQQLSDWIDKYGIKNADPHFLADISPVGIGTQYLEERFVFQGVLTLRHHRGSFWKYKDGRYQEVEADLMSEGLYNFLADKFYVKDGKTTKYVVDKTKVDYALHALSAIVQIKNGKNTTEPFVIAGTRPTVNFKREKCVIFKNGILDIDTNKLTPLSPEFFLTSTLPYSYNPDMPCPEWEKALREWFNDEKAIILLQQWFGYNLIADNKFEKMMILFGIPASGKSTTTTILRALLGPERCAAIDFADLQYSFGLEQLLDKYTAVLSEDQTSRRIGGDQVLQALKRFTGNNIISVRRKFRDTLAINFFTRFTYETNELPHFMDIPQALARRALILQYVNSFEESPNVNLKTLLLQEIQGIANWAIRGLKSLSEQGYFTEPGSSVEAKEELRRQTSPMAAMIDECCIFDTTAHVLNEQLYELYKVWAKDNGYPVFNRVWFGRYIVNTCKGKIKCYRPLVQGERVRATVGLKITNEAFQRYLGRPV